MSILSPPPSVIRGVRADRRVLKTWAAAVLPGVTLAVSAALSAIVVGRFAGLLSPLVVALILGVAVVNAGVLSARCVDGLRWSARHLLRVGIALLGLDLVLGDVLALGWSLIASVVAVVVGTFGATVGIGRLLRLPTDHALLIAAGFSICGAAAVAAADGVLRARATQVASTIALVVVFGTAMIGIIPAAAAGLGLSAAASGGWVGGAIHEVAQVVAAGGMLGGGALAVAVVVKLARVLMLAPVMIGLGIYRRRTEGDDQPTLPPLVPGFILGFLACVVIASLGFLPHGLAEGVSVLRTIALSAAMFALGTTVDRSVLSQMRGRSVALAAIATVIVTLLALAFVVPVIG